MATILTKKSDTASAVPATGDLTHSSGGAELAVNTADKRLFVKDSGGTVRELGTNPSTLTTATLSVTGNSTLGDASGDSVTINASTVSTPNGLNFDSNTLVIDATNNRVGIGTASPSEMVDISSANTGGTTLELDNTSTGGRNWILYSSGSGNSFGAGKFTIFDGSAGSTRMLIDTSGNVGVGTSSPSYKLESLGTTPAYFGSNTSDGTRFGYATALPSNSSNCFVGWVPDTVAGTNGALALCPRTSAGAPIVFFTGTTSATERMRITSSGDVGIGTTSPTFNSGTGLEIQRTDTATLRVERTGSTASAGEFFAGNDQVVLQSASSTPLVFRTNATERMRIDSSGNVGIGTSSPSAKLDVNQGSASGYSLVVDRTGNASSVGFKQDGTITGQINALSGGGLILYTGSTPTERVRINSSGALKAKAGSAGYWNSGASYHESANSSETEPAHLFYSTNTSFVNEHISSIIARSSNSAFSCAKFYTNAASDTEFNLRGDGQAYADGSWNGGGADYAEYFEWLDGNTSNEDRRGFTVVLDGNMIRKATDTDDASKIIGAVSATPCVIGDHADNKWSGKFLKDDFGNYIREEHNVVEWLETIVDEEGNESTKQHSYEDWNIPDGVVVPDDATVLTHDENGNRFDHRKLNPNFDPTIEYIPREKRPEWSPIGMMGKLRILKGQPVGDRWIKMRDISEAVEEWFVR